MREVGKFITFRCQVAEDAVYQKLLSAVDVLSSYWENKNEKVT